MLPLQGFKQSILFIKGKVGHEKLKVVQEI